MLPDTYRLKHKRDFDTLVKDGVFVNGDLATMKLWKIDPTKFPRRAYQVTDLRIGFVVGLKVSKSAVKRNRIKRQMREVVRLLLLENKITPGYLVAFFAKKDMLEKEYKVIETDVVRMLKRSGLFKSEIQSTKFETISNG